RFSKGIFSWVGYNTVSIPYEVKEREAGETKWNFRKLLKYAFEGIMAYTDMPLKLPFYLAAFSLVLGVIMLFAYSIVSGLVLFVGAATLFSLGVIGTYIGKIHTQVKNRPIYIAKEILSYDKHD
ncbi:MAG: glycosyltransferase, partial [Clostridia bacterium]|nr:glycosyltransferase [Clostridia bacterium]